MMNVDDIFSHRRKKDLFRKIFNVQAIVGHGAARLHKTSLKWAELMLILLRQRTSDGKRSGFALQHTFTVFFAT
jgi:hypothetical protein